MSPCKKCRISINKKKLKKRMESASQRSKENSFGTLTPSALSALAGSVSDATSTSITYTVKFFGERNAVRAVLSLSLSLFPSLSWLTSSFLRFGRPHCLRAVAGYFFSSQPRRRKKRQRKRERERLCGE